MARRLKPTLADYVVIAINPVLIMGLVGSLVYFLLEIFYAGAYPARLQFSLTMFVFAIVLISRISMESGLERAAPFGIALAVLVGIAMNRYVDYHGAGAEAYGWAINWGLMALTWWCAHKLTWDCTTIEDGDEASGRGLLETAGLERSTDDPAASAPPLPLDPETGEPTAKPAELPPATELSQTRWQQLLDRPKRAHTPGVWIVYFSLASLPIFGIGQLFIPAEKTASRRYVFLLLCVYVACGLSLLLTTSFLSLRRYLRQRRMVMPAAMAGNWLSIGGVMVLGLLLFSALLPRPAPEYEISAIPGQLDSHQHSASSVSAGSEGVRDPEAGSDSGVDHSPDAANQPPPDNAAGSDTKQTSQGPNGQVAGKSGTPSADKGPQSAGGKAGEKSGEKSQSAADNQSAKRTDKQSEKSSSEKQSSGQQSGQPANPSAAKPNDSGDKPPQSDAKSEPQKNPTDQSQPKPNPQTADKTDNQPPPADAAKDQSQAAQQAPPPQQTPPATPPLPSFGSWFGGLAGLFKWAFYAAVAAGVAYGAWLCRTEVAQIVAGWLAALRDFWRSLVGGDEMGPTAGEVAFHQQQLGWSFSDFANPFANGLAARSAPAELVKFTFAAMEAWGREQGVSRGSDETPHEFVAQLGARIPALKTDAQSLANLYARAVYSPAPLPAAAVANLGQLWQLMQATPAPQPAIHD